MFMCVYCMKQNIKEYSLNSATIKNTKQNKRKEKTRLLSFSLHYSTALINSPNALHSCIGRLIILIMYVQYVKFRL